MRILKIDSIFSAFDFISSELLISNSFLGDNQNNEKLRFKTKLKRIVKINQK
jgi:hypothetical protein